MSNAGDRTENWRGGYDGWLSHDRRNDDPEQADHSPKTCAVCGSLIPTYATYAIAGCHTPRERDAAANARRYRK